MPETSRTSSWVPMFVAVCLVAVNMRMSVAGIGPMLDSIARSESVQAGMLGMLASLPLLAWALVSPLAQGLASRIGLDAAVSWAQQQRTTLHARLQRIAALRRALEALPAAPAG